MVRQTCQITLAANKKEGQKKDMPWAHVLPAMASHILDPRGEPRPQTLGLNLMTLRPSPNPKQESDI